MSLHTSEVPISDDLGPGGLQSLPVPSPLSPGDHAVVMQAPEFSSLDTDDGKRQRRGENCAMNINDFSLAGAGDILVY